MYCENCGHEVAAGEVSCPSCGQVVPVKAVSASTMDGYSTANSTPTMDGYSTANPTPVVGQTPVNDKGGFLWGLLGCCVPLAGLILFLVWKDQKPKTAKAAGIGALVSVVLGVIYYIIVFVLMGISAAYM